MGFRLLGFRVSCFRALGFKHSRVNKGKGHDMRKRDEKSFREFVVYLYRDEEGAIRASCSGFRFTV